MATDERVQNMMDDFKNNGGGPLFTNISTGAVAEQKGKEGDRTHRLELRDIGDGLSRDTYEQLMRSLNNYAYRYGGAGSWDHQYQQAFTGFDKYSYHPINPNVELAGYTFITRPKLNLGIGAVASDPILGLLDTVVPTSPAFSIRCMLDTKFCTDNPLAALSSNLVDTKSPFIKLLTNCSRANSGWPDLNADTFTTEGGYFSEDQTTFLGFDNLQRTYDLNLEFTDIQGGHVMALLYYWFYYMSQLKRGRVFAYAEDIDARRLCYTCSIYRFLMDPSKQVITKWSKATGCFPKNVPIGACFNANAGEIHVSSSQHFSVPFVANKIEYNDPRILADFNTITRRFNPYIKDGLLAPINQPEYNFCGRPYVLQYNGAYRLVWYYSVDEEPRDGFPYMVEQAKKEMATNQPVPIEGEWI